MTDLQDALDGYVWNIEGDNKQRARIIEAAARLVANLRTELAHHLTERHDPCQDRGVEWPCDVAAALTPGTTE